MADVCLGAIGSRAELGRDGVRAEPCRHHLDRALPAQAVRDLYQTQLGLEIEPVPGLGFDRSDTVGEHLVEPAPAVGQQVGLRRGPRRGDGGQDPATRGEDVQVGGAVLAQDELVLARAGEEQVGVRIDEARGHRAPGGIEAGEPGKWQAVGFDLGLDRLATADRRDAPFPDGDHGRVGRGGIGPGQSSDVALPRAATDAAGERDDLVSADDQQTRCGLPGPSPFDDAERSAAHVSRGRSPRVVGSTS